MDKTDQSSIAAQTFFDLTQSNIYLMGGSFVLGSMFTLFLLLVLDFVRSGKRDKHF